MFTVFELARETFLCVGLFNNEIKITKYRLKLTRLRLRKVILANNIEITVMLAKNNC
jgi:hypothetical protein